VAILALVLTGCGWPQWGGGPEHRGSTVFSGGSPSAITGWTARQLTAVPASAPVAVAGGLVFHVTDGRIRALDPTTGGVVWAAELPAGTVAGTAPAVYGTGATATVFVEIGGATGTLVGFDVAGVRNCNLVTFTCRPVFRASVGSGATAPAPVLVSGDRVFVDGAGELLAFDARGATNCITVVGTSVCAPIWSADIGSTAVGVGPAARGDAVYAVGEVTGIASVVALDAATGAERWRGTLDGPAAATPSIGTDGRVFVPSGAGIAAFAGAGCGAATCVPDFTLVKRAADPDGSFLATPTIAGSTVVATASTGVLSAWPAGGCGTATCAATDSVVVHAPAASSVPYQRTPVVADGILYVVAERSIAGADHVLLVASDAATLAEHRTWDLGTSGFGSGLADAALAFGVVYVPVGDGLDAVGAPVVHPLASLTLSPLAISPAFDPTIHDYAMHCAAGTNDVTVTMQAVAGGTVRLIGPIVTPRAAERTRDVALAVDQAVVVEAADALGRTAQYWIRCLPPDFPTITATRHPTAGDPTPGWYVVGNAVTPTDRARFAMVLDSHGTPVWYKRAGANVQNVTPLVPNQVAFMPTPTFAFGTDPNGRYDVYDLFAGTASPVSSIRTVGMPTDLHELQTLPNGDRLLLSYPLKRGVDLTGLPGAPGAGPDSTIADCVVQQLDSQGNLVWEWTASDHFDPITETTSVLVTTVGTETVYDVFHCNSIDPNPNGNVLVSARHMNAVFEVRRSDGIVVWKLGGTPVNRDGAAILTIQDDPDNGPVQQHDARYLPNGEVGIYDNRTSGSARGIEYSLDLGARTATLVFSFEQPSSMASCCMGSFRASPDGHRVIGWGYVLFDGLAVTELDASGDDVLDIVFAGGTASYRAVKVPPTFYDLAAMRLTAGT
jgi:outer membrane protein assembly factor BamB